MLRNFLEGGLGALSIQELEERLRSWDDKERRAPRSFLESGSCTGSDVDDDASCAKGRGSVNQAGRTNDRKRKTVNFRSRHLLWTSRMRWSVWMSRRSQTGRKAEACGTGTWACIHEGVAVFFFRWRPRCLLPSVQVQLRCRLRPACVTILPIMITSDIGSSIQKPFRNKNNGKLLPDLSIKKNSWSASNYENYRCASLSFSHSFFSSLSLFSCLSLSLSLHMSVTLFSHVSLSSHTSLFFCLCSSLFLSLLLITLS